MRRFFTPGLTNAVNVNGKIYHAPQKRHVALVILSGIGKAQIEAAIGDGRMPFWQSMITSPAIQRKSPGCSGWISAQIPPLTLPNAVGIITGVSAKQHGISLNLAGTSELCHEKQLIRADSVLAALQRQCALPIHVLSSNCEVTTSLTHQLQLNPDNSATLQTFRANASSHPSHADFTALQTACSLLQDFQQCDARPSVILVYLSSTIAGMFDAGVDGMQTYLSVVDEMLAELYNSGANVVCTADHGTSIKSGYSGAPNVLNLRDFVSDFDCTVVDAVDESCLASGFAMLHVDQQQHIQPLLEQLRRSTYVYSATNRDHASRDFELAPDTVGDIVVIAKENAAFVSSKWPHCSPPQRLLTSGSFAELQVPLLATWRLPPSLLQHLHQGKLRTWDALRCALSECESDIR